MSNTNDVQAKAKKMFLKRWWFWVIVAAIIPGIIGSSSELCNAKKAVQPSAEPTSSKITKTQAGKASHAPSVISQVATYKDGKYKVGQDIPAGEYKTILKTNNGYVKVSTDSLGKLEISKSNENAACDSYITLQDGQHIELSGVELSIK